MTRAADPAVPGSGPAPKVAHYRLTGSIGQGSTAAVHLAQDERLHHQVALKVLVPEQARDAAFRARMIRESQAAAAVGHPHIIPVYEAGEADGLVYVAMRYVRGEDARSLLNRLGPLPPGYAWNIIAQIASALDAAHARGLIHGDVKPANILLEASDTAGEVTPQRAGDYEPGHAYRFSPSGPDSTARAATRDNAIAGMPHLVHVDLSLDPPANSGSSFPA